MSLKGLYISRLWRAGTRSSKRFLSIFQNTRLMLCVGLPLTFSQLLSSLHLSLWSQVLPSQLRKCTDHKTSSLGVSTLFALRFSPFLTNAWIIVFMTLGPGLMYLITATSPKAAWIPLLVPALFHQNNAPNHISSIQANSFLHWNRIALRRHRISSLGTPPSFPSRPRSRFPGLRTEFWQYFRHNHWFVSLWYYPTPRHGVDSLFVFLKVPPCLQTS